MTEKKLQQTTFKVTLTLSDKKIETGDLFFFSQHDGLPTIRRAKENEDWNGWTNSKTGEKEYFKIEKIEGLLISPKEIFKNLTSIQP